MTMRLFSCLGLLALVAAQAAHSISHKLPAGEIDQVAFRIEDAKCRVGLLAVKLSVGRLIQEDGVLVGDYVIDVPLFKSKGDHGRITLPIDMPLERISEEGGILTGEGHSEKNPGEIHKIVCTIRPLDDKRIKLAVTTSQRTIYFTSSYELIEAD